jgi:scyllo-inositol 2-dehydrogenase (NADP+)
MINVGIIGFGISAQVFHLPFLKEIKDYNIKYIASSKLELIKKTIPKAVCHNNIDELFSNKDIDLIIITSPNDTHYQYTKKALNSNCNVLVEKPFVINHQQGIELHNLAKTKNLKLCVYQNRRWDSDFLTIKKLMESNILKNIKLFESHFDRNRPNVKKKWRELPGIGTGVLYDLGSHLIDQALELFHEPKYISASCKQLRDKSKVIDYFTIILHYTDKEVILRSSPFQLNENPRFNIQCENQNLTITGLDIQEQQLRQNKSINSNNFGISNNKAKLIISEKNNPEKYIKKLISQQKGCYIKLYKDLAAAITQDKCVPVDAISASKVIYAIELSQKSAIENKRIPWGFKI